MAFYVCRPHKTSSTFDSNKVLGRVGVWSGRLRACWQLRRSWLEKWNIHRYQQKHYTLQVNLKVWDNFEWTKGRPQCRLNIHGDTIHFLQLPQKHRYSSTSLAFICSIASQNMYIWNFHLPFMFKLSWPLSISPLLLSSGIKVLQSLLENLPLHPSTSSRVGGQGRGVTPLQKQSNWLGKLLNQAKL